MSDRTDTKAAIDAAITNNGAKENTGARVNDALQDFVDKAAFTEDLGSENAPAAVELYDRISDNNTTPGEGKFSLNTLQTQIYIHKESKEYILSSLFNIMDGGVINFTYGNNYQNKARFLISAISLSGNVYTLTGKPLVSFGGYSADEEVGVTFDVNTETTGTNIQLSGTQFLKTADTVIGYPNDPEYIGFSTLDPTSASNFYYGYGGDATEKAVFELVEAVTAGSGKVILRATADTSKFIILAVDDTITDDGFVLTVPLDDSSCLTNISNFTDYSEYTVEVMNF